MCNFATPPIEMYDFRPFRIQSPLSCCTAVILAPCGGFVVRQEVVTACVVLVQTHGQQVAIVLQELRQETLSLLLLYTRS